MQQKVIVPVGREIRIMNGGVVYLTFSTSNVVENDNSVACVYCNSGEFRLIPRFQDFPVLQCAGCNAPIGRIGHITINEQKI